MPDFPSVNYANTPRYLGIYSRYSGLFKVSTLVGNVGGGTSGTWPVANLAVYMPMLIPFRYVVQRAWFPVVGASACNIDFGIYTTDGRLIWSAGSTAKLSNVMQFVTPATPFALEPGAYYFGVTASNTTSGQSFALAATFGSPASNHMRQAGVLEQASALPLPALATFSPISSATIFPICGVTRLASGF